MSHSHADHRPSSSDDKHSQSKSNEAKSHDHDHLQSNRIKSPEVSHHKQSLNENEQPSVNGHGQTSFEVNKPSDDGPLQPHLHTLSHEHEQQNHTDHSHADSMSSNPEARKREHNLAPAKPDEKTNKSSTSSPPHPACTFHTDKKWLDQQKNDEKPGTSKTPEELENLIKDPPGSIDPKLLDRIQGSIIGMAIGDALGAHVEFRPYEYMKEKPVTELVGGGTWGLKAGQFTDDTSMALCLANSLIACRDFIPYDQLVRYKWWYKEGYMSSTGVCFDIGAATSQSIHVFEERQEEFAKKHNIPLDQMDKLNDRDLLNEFDVYCSSDGVAGNGALMRLAPVPLFFYKNWYIAIECSGRSGEITHGDKKAADACRYYGALIVAALHGYSKEEILAGNFYSKHKQLFGKEPLHEDILEIAEGSFKKKAGYQGGIAGKGYIVKALEAALWAFWFNDQIPKDIPHEKKKPEKDSSETDQLKKVLTKEEEEAQRAAERAALEKEWVQKTPFERGALLAVNLGDDTDTTAAIYGQLAGAHYGYKALPKKWVDQVYARQFMEKLSKWIAYEGGRWSDARLKSAT